MECVEGELKRGGVDVVDVDVLFVVVGMYTEHHVISLSQFISAV